MILVALTLAMLLGSNSGRSQRINRPGGEKERDSQTVQEALLILDAAIDEVPQIENIESRLSLAEGIVKLLARRNPARARQMLDSLFEAALELKRSDPAEREQENQRLDTLVRRVIQAAARVDGGLAESYIDRYAKERSQADRPGTTAGPATVAAGEFYRRLAIELLRQDRNLAVAVAEKSLSVPLSASILIFLESLRKANSNLAKQFYVSALQIVAKRQGVDVNELLLLFAYVFSPLRVPMVTPYGLALVQMPEYARLVEDRAPDPDLARHYLQVAIDALLAPSRYAAENRVRLVAGAAGDFYLLKLIEPFSSTYLPAFSGKLQGRENLLTGLLRAEERDSVIGNLSRFTGRGERSVDQASGDPSSADALVRRAEAATDVGEKDRLYYFAATAAVQRKDYERAVSIVEHLSAGVRDKGLEFIRFSIAESALSDRRFEEAEKWALADTDPARRDYVLTLLAKTAAGGEENDLPRAAEALGEVERDVSRIGDAREKVAVLLGASAAYSHFDAIRALEMLNRAVQAANKIKDFSGDLPVNRALEIGGFTFFYRLYDNDSTLLEGLSRLARFDFEGSIMIVRQLSSRPLRLKAIIALCTGILSKEPMTADTGVRTDE